MCDALASAKSARIFPMKRSRANYLIVLNVTILSKLSSMVLANDDEYGFVSHSPPAIIDLLPPSVDIQEEAEALPMYVE